MSDTPTLAKLIADRRADILAAWERAARLLPQSVILGHPILVDHVGAMLDAITTGDATIGLPEQLDGTFDLAQMVLEIEALRDGIKKLWHGDGDEAVPLRELGILDRMFDATISEVLQRYSRARGMQRGRRVVSEAQLAVRPANAGLLVSEVLATHARFAASKGVRLRSIDEMLGADLWCDRDRIAQVFATILDKAIRVCASGDEILLRGVVGETEARFAISDPGPGVSPEELSRMFDPSSLELYVSKGIIEAHTGDLWVESSVGDGTTFFFTLPLAR